MNDIVTTSFPSGIIEEQTTVNCLAQNNRDNQEGEGEADESDVDSSPAFDAFEEISHTSGKSCHFERKFLKCCRLFIYIFTFVVVVAGGVINKLSVFKMISDNGRSSGEERQLSAIYLLVLVCLYPSFTLISSIFKLMFGKEQPLSKGTIITVMLIECLHTVGILLLIFAVLPHFSTVSSLYIMSFLPIVPSILCLVSSLVCAQGHLKKRLLIGLFYLIISLIQIGGFILLYFTDVLNTKASSTVVWIIPIAVVLVSLSWWENFTDIKLPNILRSSTDRITVREEMKHGRDKIMAYTSLSRLLTAGVCVALVTCDVIPTFIHDLLHNCNTTLPLQKSINASLQTNYSSQVNQNSTAALRMGESLGSANNTMKDQHLSQSVLDMINDFIKKHYIILLALILTFAVSYCSTLACKLRMQRFSFSLATLLITPITFLYVGLHCAHQLPQYLLIFETEDMCPTWNFVSPEQLVLLIAVWLSTCFLTYYIWLPKSEMTAKTDRMFVLPLKDCITFDYNLILRRRNDHRTMIETSENLPSYTPKVYVCVTIWHETRNEMFHVLKSLLRLDRHCAVSKTKGDTADKFESEIHVVIDDAFIVDPRSNKERPNSYVTQFLECLDEAATTILGSRCKSEWTDTPMLCTMPYGGRITILLPGQTKLVIHLKNKNKVRHRKRWSQVLYMYYILGFKSFMYREKSTVLKNRNLDKGGNGDQTWSFVSRLSDADRIKLQNTFILTLDGDVDFKPSSVLRLLDRMKKNVQVGAVCGRIRPVGTGPVVWFQKFEYAFSHWLQKVAEHVLGCVLCCPGCFSLFRASALVDSNVIKTYTRKPTEALHYLHFEQGEDRWLCTLLMQQGYKIEYCGGTNAKTFAPETFNDFYIQRRRWSPSFYVNFVEILSSWRHIVSRNVYISRMFIVYQFFIASTGILAPSYVIMTISLTYDTILDISDWHAFLLSIAPPIFYIIVCLKLPDSYQLTIAAVLSAVYSVVMVMFTLSLLVVLTNGDILSPFVLFIVCNLAIVLLAGLLHPGDIRCLLYGIIYYMALPSMFIFLTIYFICNIHNVKWGTRENSPTEQTKENMSLVDSIKPMVHQLVKHKQHGGDMVQDSNLEICEPQALSQKPETENSKHAKDISHSTDVDWEFLDPIIQYRHDNETPKHEEKFWKKVLPKYLEPIESDKKHEQKISVELVSLRNNMVFVFSMLNLLFSVVLFQMQVNKDSFGSLYLFGKYEPSSVISFGLIILIQAVQFISMLIHRWNTFQHSISRSSLTSCSNEKESENFKINYYTAEQLVGDDPETDYVLPGVQKDSVCNNHITIDVNDSNLLQEALGTRGSYYRSNV